MIEPNLTREEIDAIGEFYEMFCRYRDRLPAFDASQLPQVNTNATIGLGKILYCREMNIIEDMRKAN